MNRVRIFLLVITTLLLTTGGDVLAKDSPLRFGWVVGSADGEMSQSSVSILHTRNGGRKWVEQADISRWEGYNPNDVSAVDRLTAWVALGSSRGEDYGAILHTTNGGATWREQRLPQGVGVIKQIKGLSRHEAWAVSLTGTVLHTTDSGETWSIVEHPSASIGTVNRMDVIGCRSPQSTVGPDSNKLMSNANIWIVDEDGDNQGMVHSLYNGDLWRKEDVPFYYNGMHMVSAYSPRVVWAATYRDGRLYRTLDGGENWEIAATISGPNDFDDMCAPSADTVWAVQNQNSAGQIFHVRLKDGHDPDVDGFDPFNGYLYEGMTCVDDQTALVVGFTLDPSLPRGIILSTTDGGESWTRHSAPIDDVKLWKTSFVDARR